MKSAFEEGGASFEAADSSSRSLVAINAHLDVVYRLPGRREALHTPRATRPGLVQAHPPHVR
jgi:hypothetical protein